MTNDNALFNRAVELIRKGTGYVDLQNELEGLALPGTDILDVINAATRYVKETQDAAFECATEAFKNGESFFNVCKKLEACGFHSWDAMLVAGRAKQAAEAEPTVTKVSGV